MLFSWQRGHQPLYGFGVLVVLVAGLLLGCDENPTKQGDVFSDTAQRVEANVLPPVVDESAVVLRNLVHMLAVLPEICTTPFAELRTFTSTLPTLQTPNTVAFDNTEGSWQMTWSDRVLGDDDNQLTVDTTTPRVDVTLIMRFRGQAQQILRAIPFSLLPQTTLQTAIEPPSFAAGATEGFFLSQDRDSGLWTLRWRNLGATKIFEGRLNATSFTRVIKHVVDRPDDTVTSLEISGATDEITFRETTAVTDQKGFTFFARPGDTIRFRLHIGTSDSTLQSITREQLRIGGGDQQLPDNLNPADFRLLSNLPGDPTGAPNFTPGTDLGTFIWQEVNNNTCNAGEDQWHMRFSRQNSTTTFSGVVRGVDENNQVSMRVTPIGVCPVGRLDDADRTFSYDCTLADNTPSGYDFCVTAGKRVDFTPELNREQHPGFIFIGAAADAPPSPEPFTILFALNLTERQSSHNLSFSDTDSHGRIVLAGNNEEDGATLLNPDQVSLEPLCRPPDQPLVKQPRVRLTGGGDYATTRFGGSAYELDDVEFHDTNVTALDDQRRFPDGGDIRLRTRVDIEDTTVTVPTAEIVSHNGQTTVPVDVEMQVTGVRFEFPDRSIPLTVE
jgi:hypothetical protein